MVRDRIGVNYVWVTDNDANERKIIGDGDPYGKEGTRRTRGAALLSKYILVDELFSAKRRAEPNDIIILADCM